MLSKINKFYAVSGLKITHPWRYAFWMVVAMTLNGVNVYRMLKEHNKQMDETYRAGYRTGMIDSYVA